MGLIVAIRKADFRGGSSAGAIEKPCPACGAIMILSRGSQKRLESGYVAYCNRCIGQELARDGRGIEVELPTAEEWADSQGFSEKN